MDKSGRLAELLKIGELAQAARVLPSTIHYYTREGLLKFADQSPGGYRLYDRSWALKRLKEIQRLQASRRLTIREIKKYFRR
ncbi:MAG: MerR family transcriptional regulator [Patescibacteria group bacterium]|jgi:DNA-binding transcriptional MerR regulator